MSIPFHEQWHAEDKALFQEMTATALELTGAEPTDQEIIDLSLAAMMTFAIAWDADAYEARYHAKNPEA